MDNTANLTLPYLMAAQAQKHVTHNEAIRALDVLVQMMVLDKDLAAPPVSPSEGDRYIVAGSPTGAWAGEAGKIAAYQDGAWLFYTPREGWIAWIADESTVYVHDGSDWGRLIGEIGLVDKLGINATADTTNRLAIASTASLFSHAGNGHQQKINKAAASDTASQLYQTGFSGRAEFGLIGSDDFSVKVSPDGSSWIVALAIDKDTGAASLLDTTLAGALTVVSGGSPSTLFGLDVTALSAGAGAITFLDALHGLANHGGSGLCSTAFGVNTRVAISGSGNIGDAYGLQVNSPLRTGAGVFTGAVVGVQIADQSGAGGVINWNLYSIGANSLNVFDGTLQLNKLAANTLIGIDANKQTISVGIAPIMRSGRYYGPPMRALETTFAPITNGRLFYIPFVIQRAASFDRITAVVDTVATSGGLLRLGIYADNGGAPGSRVLDAGTIASTSTGVREITISQALSAGVYWLAVAGQGAPGTQAILVAGLEDQVGVGFGTGEIPNGAAAALYEDGITGALPSTANATLSVTPFGPRLLLRAA